MIEVTHGKDFVYPEHTVEAIRQLQALVQELQRHTQAQAQPSDRMTATEVMARHAEKFGPQNTAYGMHTLTEIIDGGGPWEYPGPEVQP